MKKDLQKPILYKADPDIFMHLENMKDTINPHGKKTI